MLAGGMRQMHVHPKARHAVLKDSSLCKHRVGLDAPASQNIEDVEKDTSNNEAHGIGRVQSHQYQEDKEQGMTDDECFIGEPPHGPGCSHDDETQGGVGCKAVLDLGQRQLLCQERFPGHPAVDHKAHVDRDQDEQAYAQESMDLVDTMVRKPCEVTDD